MSGSSFVFSIDVKKGTSGGNIRIKNLSLFGGELEETENVGTLRFPFG